MRVDQGRIVLDSGATLTGVTWTGPLRKMNYEINLEAMKIDGSDFFCALTFPVAEAGCTFVVGGWGGAVVGLSSIDGQDASENETTKFMAFEKGRWYRIRARVTASRIQAWIDEDSMVDLDTTDRRIGMRFGEIELSQPLGLASYQTTAAVRQIRLRPLD